MTMVEKMARAMDPECFDPEVERVYGNLWAFQKQAVMKMYARCALKAMREPTDEVLVSMEEACPKLMFFAAKQQSPSYIAWVAAIDQAINAATAIGNRRA